MSEAAVWSALKVVDRRHCQRCPTYSGAPSRSTQLRSLGQSRESWHGSASVFPIWGRRREKTDASRRKVLVGSVLFLLLRIKSRDSTLSYSERRSLCPYLTTGTFYQTHRLSRQMICVKIWIEELMFSPLSVHNTEGSGLFEPRRTTALESANSDSLSCSTVPFAAALHERHRLMVNFCTLELRPP